MTKQDYIDKINEFFKTTENRIHWNSYATKKDAQKNGIETPTCTVDFLKDGIVVRTATCGTEIDCLRKICQEVYDATYQENLEKWKVESENYQKNLADKREKERIAKLESTILSAIAERNMCMIQKFGGQSRQCCVAGIGILKDNTMAIMIYQLFGTPESDNKKWHIIKECDIETFHIMDFMDALTKAPDEFDSSELWNDFVQIKSKINFPKEEKKGFFSKLFGKK